VRLLAAVKLKKRKGKKKSAFFATNPQTHPHMSGPGKNEQEEQVEHLRELITALHPGAVTTTEPIPATSQQPSSSSSSSTAPAQLAPLSQQPRQTAPVSPPFLCAKSINQSIHQSINQSTKSQI
jgi:hypothetical protein